MARLALLAFGMLLTCAAWLWWHLDPAAIAPAMAAAESSYTAAEPSSPLVAKGRRVPSAEPPSAAAGHASTSLASPERRAVVKNAKRYVIHGVVTRGGVGQPGREVLCSGGRGQKPATAVTGRDGVFAFEVDPGEYELYTPHTLGTTRQQAAYKRFPPSGRDRLAAAKCSGCDCG